MTAGVICRCKTKKVIKSTCTCCVTNKLWIRLDWIFRAVVNVNREFIQHRVMTTALCVLSGNVDVSGDSVEISDENNAAVRC